MKPLLLLIFALSTLSILSFAQSSPEPFKKANNILIETEMDSKSAFEAWGRHIVQYGYSIDKSDFNFLTVTTGPKDTSKFNYDFILISSVTDSGTIILTMKWRLKSNIMAGTSSTNFSDWYFATGKNNVLNIIYKDVLPTIKLFKPIKIVYEMR